MKRDKYGNLEILGSISMLIFFAIGITIVLFFAIVSLNYYRGVDKRKSEVAHNFVSIIIPAALDSYKEDIGSYPTTAQGLSALWRAPYGSENAWEGPYTTPNLKDPWGRDYQYVYPGEHNEGSYDIWSKGVKPLDPSDDILNWNKPNLN